MAVPMNSLLKFVFVAALASLLAACGPRGHRHDGQNYQNQQGTQTQTQNLNDTGKGKGHKLRKACGDEIQKYCSSGGKLRKCLQQNIDKLGDRCKTKLNAILERRKERRELRDYNATHQQGQQAQPAGTAPQGQMQQPQSPTQQQAQPNKKPSDDDDDDDD